MPTRILLSFFVASLAATCLLTMAASAAPASAPAVAAHGPAPAVVGGSGGHGGRGPGAVAHVASAAAAAHLPGHHKSYGGARLFSNQWSRFLMASPCYDVFTSNIKDYCGKPVKMKTSG